MILDQIGNLSQYKDGSRLQQAITFIQTHDISRLPIGITKIDGERLFCNIQEYDSKHLEEVRGEAHQKYIDLQCILLGEEKIGYCPLDQAGSAVEADPEKDIWFYRNPSATELLLRTGMFVVFYPQDVHAPCQMLDQPARVKKAVFKILI
ncbi:hypothetical protein B6K86_07645 [Lachnospiraceae bacterium]|jgi:hypothetical protein|nr:hypothetical protein B6K86_07645 [Lachnospiraceae bacterium]